MVVEHSPGVLHARLKSLADLTDAQGTELRETLLVEQADGGPVSLVVEVDPEVAKVQLDTGRFWVRLAEDGLLKSLAIVSPWAAIRLMGRAVALAVHERGLPVEVDTFTDPDEALRWATHDDESISPVDRSFTQKLI